MNSDWMTLHYTAVRLTTRIMDFEFDFLHKCYIYIYIMDHLDTRHGRFIATFHLQRWTPKSWHAPTLLVLWQPKLIAAHILSR